MGNLLRRVVRHSKSAAAFLPVTQFVGFGINGTLGRRQTAVGFHRAAGNVREPGRAADNPIFLYLEAFDPDQQEVANLKEAYERTGVGNKVLKDRLTEVLHTLLEPVREKRAYYEERMPLVREALEAGTHRARVLSRETMGMVRDAMDINYLDRYRNGGAS